MYILTKEEVSKHLPKLVVSQRYCDFSEKQQAANDTLMEELEELSEKEKAITKGMSEKEIKSSEEVMKLEAAIAARQTFLQELTLSEKLLEQSSSDIAKKLVTGDKSSKLQVLKDMVSEIVDSGEKVCIFSRFAKMQPIIAEAIHSVPELKNVGIAYVRGELSSERRDEEVYTKFRDNDDYKVLVCSDAGAEGLNLSLCKYLIELEPAVSYAIQTQRHGRLERADSVHDTVFVTQLIASNSWDEIMMKSIEKKEKFDMSIIKGVDLEIIG
jgi:SNF2 family DNA or RNA helicase